LGWLMLNTIAIYNVNKRFWKISEVDLNQIKRNELFDNVFIEKSRPDSDCEFQFCVLSILSIASEKFGFSWLNINDIISIIINVLGDSGWIPPEKELRHITLQYLNNNLKGAVLVENEERLSLFNVIKINKDFLKVKKFREIFDKCLKHFTAKYPYPSFKDDLINGLLKEMASLSRYKRKKANFVIRFHATKGFGKKRDDIYSTILDMIDQAKCSIKFMIAYYSEDLKALARLLGSKAYEGTQVQIILRWAEDSKEENKNLIEEIFRTINLKQGGWENFKYALYPIFKKPIENDYLLANLHAKMLIIDRNILLISSANVTIPSLRRNIEVALSTTHTDTVNEAIRFFDEIWDSLETNPRL